MRTALAADFMYCPQIVVDSFFASFYHSLHTASFDRRMGKTGRFHSTRHQARTSSQVLARPTKGVGKGSQARVSVRYPREGCVETQALTGTLAESQQQLLA